ncbi:MAG TPA: ATP-binding protein [Jatrophihabitans sp.]|nr:ATP-binding protein [Jatrophihabitans sp.]
MTRSQHPGTATEAAFVLPIAFFGMLLIGVVAAATGGRFGGAWVVAAAAVLVGTLAWLSTPLTAAPLAAIGWFTVSGFSHMPLGQLHPKGTLVPGAVLAGVAALAASGGVASRYRENARAALHDRRGTLDPVKVVSRARQPVSGLSRRRQLAGVALAGAVLPLLTVLLVAMQTHLAFPDELLAYLLAVLLVTLVGGFWPAVLAAVAACLLLNWFFTPPLHTWTIESPENLFALLLFVASAVTVSGVVHFAARRDAVARERTAEASALLALARTVLGGDDTPRAVLDHLSDATGLHAELQELVESRWVRIAGTEGDGEPRAVPAGEHLRLIVYGDLTRMRAGLLDGYAAQAAAACERQRLRIQAGQAEALAEGNRMRTALLAAVSHDLRTPLASVKAAVGSLRQTDVQWSREDQVSLLETIEEGADRLDSLIGNLLDMSRVQIGAVQPFIRPVALDEVAPLAVRGLDGAQRLRLAIPDALPLVTTDPGLLERALANLVANALRYSPADRPPTVAARCDDARTVVIEVIDHGPGIPVDQREHAFQPFQQLGDRHTSEGVGLGLAVAKGLIEAVGGSIVADSTPGGGLTMRVELPAAPTPRLTASGTA